jgi:hypothetical protein
LRRSLLVFSISVRVEINVRSAAAAPTADHTGVANMGKSMMIDYINPGNIIK